MPFGVNVKIKLGYAVAGDWTDYAEKEKFFIQKSTKMKAILEDKTIDTYILF